VEIVDNNVNGISREYQDLTPYKLWNITVYTVDVNDSVPHQGAAQVWVEPDRIVNASIELQSRYFRVRGFFYPVVLASTRYEMIVDTTIVKTLTIEPATAGGDTAVVQLDYVPSRSQHVITGTVYGVINGTEVLLYSGGTVVQLPWYTDQKVIVPLAWVGGERPETYPEQVSLLLEPATSNTIHGRIGAPVPFSGTGHHYDVVNVPEGISWTDARQQAQSLTYNGMAGHLVTITSKSENDFIFGTLVGQTSASALWLGGYQSPQTTDPAANWNWVTNEPWEYTNWSGGEPNDHNSNDETYLTIWCYSGKWNDSWVKMQGYIVEYE
jgi:hypothetical protein